MRNNKEIVDEVKCIFSTVPHVVDKVFDWILEKLLWSQLGLSKYQNLYISAFDFLRHNNAVAFL